LEEKNINQKIYLIKLKKIESSYVRAMYLYYYFLSNSSLSNQEIQVLGRRNVLNRILKHLSNPQSNFLRREMSSLSKSLGKVTLKVLNVV